jgi:site-specific DNA-methyltransferase (adenine-specific)/adenine-specific DNA-methyltransferase
MDKSLLFSQYQSIAKFYNPVAEIILYPGDSNDFIKTIPDNSVSLIITSPPYNLGKDYENKISLDIYLDGQGKILKELYRILKEHGSICWQVGNFVQEGEVYPLDIFYKYICGRLVF